MSDKVPTALTSISPDFDDDASPGVAPRESSPAVSASHIDLFRSLTDLISSHNADIAKCDQNDGTVTLSRATICDRVRVIAQALTQLGPTPQYDAPNFKMIMPPEATEPSSLGRRAATLDQTKLRMLLASSRLSLHDLNSYAQLIIAEQESYRRAHRRSLPLDETAAAIYTPDEDQANRFIDVNTFIYRNFASLIDIRDYFHLLKVFTHESATDGKTSSKLLSMIGKYALKTTTYRMSYINGESYAFAKERIYKYLDEDAIYNRAIETKLSDYIIVGDDYYKNDREIVLQTVFALFGLFYTLKGENGLISLNTFIQWFDDSMSFA